MGFLDKLMKNQEKAVAVLKMTSSEAFISILIASVAIDGSVDREEMKLLSVEFSKFRGLANMNPMQIQTLIDRTIRLVDQNGINNLVLSAKGALNPDLRLTVFANAVELVLADGVVQPKEKELIELLQKWLEISDEMAQKIVEVIMIKNKGTTSDIFNDTNVNSMFS